MLIPRIITALILAPLFIWAAISMPKDNFAQLLLLFVIFGVWELSSLIKLKHLASKVLLVLVIVSCALVIYTNEQLSMAILYLSVVWWVLNLYWVCSYPDKTNVWFDPLWARLINVVLLILPTWLALIILHDYYIKYFLLLMFIVWGADSAAYFSGRIIGKTKLAPKVSPSKSVEGVIGGAIFTLLIMLVFLQCQDIKLADYPYYLLLAVITFGVSVLGDLFESLFKRKANIKDSGNILPGHGGVLDRIDSLTASAPFFLLGLKLIL